LDCPEDFFSRSLAYIVNLFPDIGQKVVSQIAVLAGERSDFFGAFRECEFVAQEFQDDHKDSKPDLKILCSDAVIYCENKLDAPLNLQQVEKHAKLRGYKVFISNIHHKNPR